MESFISSFILCSTPQSDQDGHQILSEIPRSVDLARQRRAHRKSRAGCESCKKRRVKCDETNPCQNCKRRGDRCVRSQAVNVVHRTVSARRMTSTPSLPSSISSLHPTVASMSSMIAQTNGVAPKLLHHFQTNTRQTLLFDPAVWDPVLQLCFDFDFVLDAILCIAARHLAFLQPHGNDSKHSSSTSYSTLATYHLCRALSNFRTQLSNNLIAMHPDAFIAISLLLQFDVWADTDYLVNTAQQQQQNTNACCGASFEPSQDRIFAFCASLKGMFLKSFPQEAVEKSVLMPYIQHNAMNTLAQQVHLDQATLEGYRFFFSRQRVMALQMLKNDEEESAVSSKDGVVASSSITKQDYSPRNAVLVEKEPDSSYAQIVDQLALILSFLPPEYNASDKTGSSTRPIPLDLMNKLGRHILAFPTTCRGMFTSMIARNDPHAVLLLCHFYRAVNKLLDSTRFWWAQKRATTLEKALKAWLVEKYAV